MLVLSALRTLTTFKIPRKVDLFQQISTGQNLRHLPHQALPVRLWRITSSTSLNRSIAAEE